MSNTTLRNILIHNGSLDYNDIEDQIEELENMLGDAPEESEEDSLEIKVAALNLIEEGAGDRYEELLEIRADMDDNGIGPYDTVMTEDELEAEVQQLFDDEMRNISDWIVVDEEASKDNIKDEYTTGEVCGVTLYWR